jgi:hypothetical protein
MPGVLPSGPLETDFVGKTRMFWGNCTLNFSSIDGWRIQVPPYFLSDGLSIPRVFHSFISKSPRYIYAGILHDFCYRSDFPHVMCRKECDKLLRLYLKLYGVGGIKRHLIYTSVRAFGWISFRRHKAKYYEHQRTSIL